MQSFSHHDKKLALISAPEISHDLESGLLNPILASNEPLQSLLLIGADDLFLTEQILEKKPCTHMTRYRSDDHYPMSPEPWHTKTIDFLELKNQQSPVDAIILSKLHAQTLELGDAFEKLGNMIKPGGLLVLSTLIYSENIPDFPSLHALGDALMQNGFSHPIVERHQMTYRFSSPKKKQQALLAIGIQEPSLATSMSLTWAIAHAWRQKPDNMIKLPKSRHQR